MFTNIVLYINWFLNLCHTVLLHLDSIQTHSSKLYNYRKLQFWETSTVKLCQMRSTGKCARRARPALNLHKKEYIVAAFFFSTAAHIIFLWFHTEMMIWMWHMECNSTVKGGAVEGHPTEGRVLHGHVPYSPGRDSQANLSCFPKGK